MFGIFIKEFYVGYNPTNEQGWRLGVALFNLLMVILGDLYFSVQLYYNGWKAF
jgi:hypothetical protein